MGEVIHSLVSQSRLCGINERAYIYAWYCINNRRRGYTLQIFNLYPSIGCYVDCDINKGNTKCNNCFIIFNHISFMPFMCFGPMCGDYDLCGGRPTSY